MLSCLSGGGRAIRLDLEIIKSPSNSWASNSSSPSSALSESSNSQITISTRKPRTPRKRPNQTYNEAAHILSTAYPKIFSTKHLTKPRKYTKKTIPFLDDPPELLMPFQGIDGSGFLLLPLITEKPSFQIERKRENLLEKPCQSPGEISSQGHSLDICDEYLEDFDTRSMLDEEFEEGIDSIMGNLSMGNELTETNSNAYPVGQTDGTCYGYPIGLGFGSTFHFSFGMRSEMRPFRNVDEGDWWKFPSVNVQDITPKISKSPAEKKKKKKKVEKPVESKNSEPAKANSLQAKARKVNNSGSKVSKEEEESPLPNPNAGLLLKLNYDNVLKEWSDKASPFSGEFTGCEASGNDVQARLAQIDLFSEGGVREASVLRYKEKRRTRLFSKKIRYQVRKVNADRRPRMKGRFVRTPHSPNSTESDQG